MLRSGIVVFLLGCSSAAFSFEISDNFWPQGQATFFVGMPGVAPSGESWNAAFNRAMLAWTNRTNFVFNSRAEFRDPCSGQDTSALGDGDGGAGFATTQCGTEFGDNVLAITLTTLRCLNTDCNGPKEITESDIIFNDTLSWDIYSGPKRPQLQDFERVALHELGHALGLNHEFTSDAIMQPFAGDLNTLQQDDINGANAIYVNATALPSIYGIPIQLSANPLLDGPRDVINLNGSLDSSDSKVDDKHIDIYQFTFSKDSRVNISLNSQAFDTNLVFARIDSTQQLVNGQTYADDNSGNNSNSLLVQEIKAGSYWLGVTSSSNNATGNYDVGLEAVTSSSVSSATTFNSIYGIKVEVNPNPAIAGELESSDSNFNSKLIDIYQFEVTAAIKLRIDASSTQFDTRLVLVDVNEQQQFGNVLLENDDNGAGTNSTIEAELQPGTYWMAVTSFESGESGSYDLVTTIVF